MRSQQGMEMGSVCFFSLSCEKRPEAIKVANGNDAKETLAENRLIKTALIAELTWAKIYTKTMNKDLGDISTAVSKREPPTSGAEMKKSAEKLHDQLQTANRTVGELNDHAGTRPVSV